MLESDGEKKSLLRVSKMLLLFRLNFRTDSSKAKHALLPYIKEKLALHEVD